MRDRPFQLGVGAALDSQLAVAFGDADGARAAHERQRRLERASREVDAVRRQLRDAVRHDRAREVDRLAFRTPQRYLHCVRRMKYMPHTGSSASARGNRVVRGARFR